MIFSTSRIAPTITNRMPIATVVDDPTSAPIAAIRAPTIIAKTPPSFYARRIDPSTARVAMATSLSGSICQSDQPGWFSVVLQEIGQRTAFNHLQSAQFLSIFGGRKIPSQPGAREALPPGLPLSRRKVTYEV